MRSFYLFLVFAILWYVTVRENFLTHTYGISTGTTRNMSYDIRGDVPIGGMSNVGPWNIGTIRPIRNRPMTIGSIYNSYDYERFEPYNQGQIPTHFYDNYYYQQYWNPSHGILT